jgi:hypothetical protein
MKKLMTIFGAILFASVLLTSCGSGVDEKNKKDSKPEDVRATAEKTNTDTTTNNEIVSEIKKDIASTNDVYIFKNMECNDAACKCNECSYKFIGEDGKELIINEIDEKSTSIKLYKTIEHDDEGGWVEVIPNKKYVNKKFKITFSETKCLCDGLEPNNKYKKLTSIKILE